MKAADDARDDYEPEEGCSEYEISFPGRAAADRSKHAVVWLCSKAGSAAMADLPAADLQLVEAVLRVPKINPEVASTLLKSGLRVSYADVLAAAKQGVYGVESWVSAAYTVAKEDATQQAACQAWQLPSAAWPRDVLRKALSQDSSGMVSNLVKEVPAAKELTLDAVAGLLQLAVT
ncbi:hypothetical protein OEZ86_002821 [Tetradesmus obliquus]|nr:hypothetical protein OEZ86_002821 [Tetradesmus obliquus]